MISMNKILYENNKSLLIPCVLLVLGYQKDLYHAFYPHLNILSIVILCCVSFFRGAGFNQLSIRNILLISIPLLAMVISSFRGDYADFIKYFVSSFIIASVSLTMSKDRILTVIAMISEIVYVFSLLTLPFYLIDSSHFSLWGRYTSIYFDPNYAAVIFGFFMIYRFVGNDKLDFRCAVMFTSLFLTYSKSALVCLFFVMSIKLFVRFSILNLIVLCVFVISFKLILFDSIISTLSMFELFRVEMGSNLRDVYASMAIEGIIANPFLGNGVHQISKSINFIGLSNSSFHNTYLESGFVNGIFYMMLIFFVLMSSAIRLFYERQRMFYLLLFLVVMGNNVTFTLGGVGLLPILLLLLLVIESSNIRRVNNLQKTGAL